jgi:hypothetical protein
VHRGKGRLAYSKGSCFIHFVSKRLFPTITWFAGALRFSTYRGAIEDKIPRHTGFSFKPLPSPRRAV